MTSKLRELLHRLHREGEGSISAEFVAVLIVVGAIVAALWAADIQGEVESCGKDAATAVFNVEDNEETNPCAAE